MAAYDYRCRTCDTVFEVRRAIGEQASAVRCPHQHDDVTRVWSPVAVARSSSAGGRMAQPAAATGGCCGGGCCG